MKLVFIYGPPASGKLTVAKELAKITGFRLFHNHLTFDLIESIFGFEHKRFWQYNRKLRYQILRLVAKEKINLILTYCFAKGEDENKIKKMMNIIKNVGGKVYFVQLCCEKETLRKRVKASSRKKYGKVKTVKRLDVILKKQRFFHPVPYKPNFFIDNTEISPKRAALMIKKRYKL